MCIINSNFTNNNNNNIIKLIVCSPKSEVIAELEKRYNLEISDANVAIKYDFDDTHVADLTYESVDLLLNTANIIFKGER